MFRFISLVCLVAILSLGWLTFAQETARPDFVIYRDKLAKNWEDMSWHCEPNYRSTACVYEGRYAISVKYTRGWGGLAFAYRSGFPTFGYRRLEFYVNGGRQGGQELRVSINYRIGNGEGTIVSVDDARYIKDGTITSNEWKLVSIPLAKLDAENTKICKINIMDNSGVSSPVFYIDDVRLTS